MGSNCGFSHRNKDSLLIEGLNCHSVHGVLIVCLLTGHCNCCYDADDVVSVESDVCC